MIYDLDPKTAGETRKAMLEWVVSNGAIVAAAHMDHPGIGRLRRDPDRYSFVPRP
jgi:hypothetical protein